MGDMDSTTRASKSIDYPHSEIHGSDSYLLNRAVTKNDGQDEEIRIQTPNTAKWTHFTLSISGTGETTVTIFEDTIKTHVANNALTPGNRNRNSSNLSGLTICHTPGAGADGTPLPFGGIFGVDAGAGNNRQLAGGESGGRDEIILKQNAAYLIRVLSGTASNRITISMSWYEHTNR